MTRLVITAHRPLRHFLGLVMLAAVAAGGGYFQQERTKLRLTAERNELDQQAERLRVVNRQLTEGNQGLRRRVTVLERAQQVERAAYREVDEGLRVLQDASLALREEVAFYRGIVSAEQDKGLNIQALVVDSDGRERGYRFLVVLTRNMKNDTAITGTLNMSVAGQHAGQLRKLTLRDLSPEEGEDGAVWSPIAFRFKYFQRLEGRLTLPEGFEPQQIFVFVTTPDEKPSKSERVFDWSTSLS